MHLVKLACIAFMVVVFFILIVADYMKGTDGGDDDLHE
jgi:hypothetical protein